MINCELWDLVDLEGLEEGLEEVPEGLEVGVPDRGGLEVGVPDRGVLEVGVPDRGVLEVGVQDPADLVGDLADLGVVSGLDLVASLVVLLMVCVA